MAVSRDVTTMLTEQTTLVLCGEGGYSPLEVLIQKQKVEPFRFVKTKQAG